MVISAVLNQKYAILKLQVMEGCGNAVFTVVRSGPELGRTCFVDYKTLDGSASAQSDFEYTEGTLCFKVKI